jgi:hypothetical protein
LFAVAIVFSKVLVEDPKENMVIHPFGKRADAMGAQDLGSCITQAAV